MYVSRRGGTYTRLDLGQTYSDVLKRVRDLFFPGGKDGHLNSQHLTYSLGNSVGDN